MTKQIVGFLCFVCLAAVATAHATVTGSFSVAVDPAGQASLQIRSTSSGTIVVETTRFGTASLRLSLLTDGATEPLARIEGPTPLKLTFDRALENTVYTLQVDNIGATRAQGTVKITYPVANCVEAAAEFKIVFAFSDRALPLESDQCRVMLQALRSLPDPLPQGIVTVEQVPPQGGIAGTYSPGLAPRIRVFGSFSGGELARIFFHEVGHHVQFQHFSKEQEKHWTELHRLSANESSAFARLYGKENEFEDWASLFEAYTRDAIFEVEAAKKATEPGSPVLVEKYRFLIQLLRHERNGKAHTYIYRTDRLGPETAVLNRASVPIGEDGLMDLSGEIVWEQF
jgi:hypothetical protein